MGYLSSIVAAGGCRALSLLLAFVAQALLAKTCGVAGYGILSVVWAWSMAAVVMSKLGFDTELVKLIAEYRAAENTREWLGVQRFAGRVVLVSGVIIGALVSVAIFTFTMGLDLEWDLFLVIALSVPMTALLQTRQACLRGNQKSILAELCTILPWCVVIPVLFDPPQFVGAVAYAKFGIFICVLVNVLGWILAELVVASILRIKARHVEPIYASSQWLRGALPLIFVQSFAVLQRTVDIVMLGLLVGPLQAGLYAACVKLAALTMFGLMAVNLIFPAKLSEYLTKGDWAQVTRVTRTGAGLSAISTIAISLPLVIYSDYALGIFGDDFIGVNLWLYILVVGQMINSLVGPVGNILIGTDNKSALLKIMSFALVINFGGNAVLIPVYGGTGAAIATAAALVFWNVAAAIYIRVKLGLKVTAIGV